MISTRRVLAGVGFIILGFMFSSLVTIIPKAQQLENQIFWTNCPILLPSEQTNTNRSAFRTYMPSCQTISDLIPSGLIATGILVLLFGFKKWTCVISVLNLMAVAIFYCNPLIDSSFKSFSHFLELVVCSCAFLLFFVRQQESESKKHVQ